MGCYLTCLLNQRRIPPIFRKSNVTIFLIRISIRICRPFIPIVKVRAVITELEPYLTGF